MKKYNLRKAATGKKNRKRLATAAKAYGTTMKVATAINSSRALYTAYQIAQMARGLNTEKKRVEASQGAGVSFAQFAGSGTGAYTVDISPIIAQSVTQSGRNGNSVKITSAIVDIQIRQSASTVSEFRFKYFIVCRPDATVASNASTCFNNFLENNPFSGVRDLHSNRDPEYFHQFRVIKTGFGKLVADQLTGQISYSQIKIPLRLNHHFKYSTDNSTTTLKNQMFLFIVADSGDVNSLTGGQVFYNIRWFYVDN